MSGSLPLPDHGWTPTGLGGAEPVGLVAGAGALPRAIAEGIRRAGHRIVCVQVAGDPGPLIDVCDAHIPLAPGDAARAMAALRETGVRHLVLAGKVDKLAALGGALDDVARHILRQAPDRRDGTLWRLVAGLLEEEGFRILPQSHFAPEMIAPAGLIGGRDPSAAERDDLTLAFALARRVAELDIGQAVAVRDGVVLAVEAAEGTDEMIRRCAAFGGGAVVAKVSRPDQDPRFDLPAVGPDTVTAMRDARAVALGVEAGRTIIVDRAALARTAEAAGLAVIGLRS
ncbi:MAG: UDP-2,3-diacylglucosamine diphosphatase LpxI [Armatimonadota bacterium]|nr:UDP-2,3-diacylglucosamine diphosphatase LpxI [Armatimonadota bacterium]MDR5697518.1 UDP-2,3-diacylglucosamine diphosphatase LpxI [Armatimonadota bacterium]